MIYDSEFQIRTALLRLMLLVVALLLLQLLLAFTLASAALLLLKCRYLYKNFSVYHDSYAQNFIVSNKKALLLQLKEPNWIYKLILTQPTQFYCIDTTDIKVLLLQ